MYKEAEPHKQTEINIHFAMAIWFTNNINRHTHTATQSTL